MDIERKLDNQWGVVASHPWLLLKEIELALKYRSFLQIRFLRE